MYYEVTVDAYNSRSGVSRGARVITYSRGYNEKSAYRGIFPIMIASDGTVSDAIRPWPGTNNLPKGDIQERSLPEGQIVSVTEVDTPGTPRIVYETMSTEEWHHHQKYCKGSTHDENDENCDYFPDASGHPEAYRPVQS